MVLKKNAVKQYNEHGFLIFFLTYHDLSQNNLYILFGKKYCTQQHRNYKQTKSLKILSRAKYQRRTRVKYRRAVMRIKEFILCGSISWRLY
jgi:hypothetical protein